MSLRFDDGYLLYDGRLTKEQVAEMKRLWEASYRGPSTEDAAIVTVEAFLKGKA